MLSVLLNEAHTLLLFLVMIGPPRSLHGYQRSALFWYPFQGPGGGYEISYRFTREIHGG